MSYSRKTDVICIIITVLMIGAVLLFMIGERIGWLAVPESATKEGESLFAASDLNDLWDRAGKYDRIRRNEETEETGVNKMRQS